MIDAARRQYGFALPTVVIASIIMLGVLLVAMSSVASVRTALANQYYNRLASEAAESGVARAHQCLKDNAYIAGWSNSSKLRPNTNCSGGAACTNASNCFVISTDTMRTSFTVDAPKETGAAQTVRSVGQVQLLRKSNGQVWKTYTVDTIARVGADISFDKISFGYAAGSGGFFFAIGQDNKIRSVGSNHNGQLGLGDTAQHLVPKVATLPAGAGTPRAVFTNFEAKGYNSFVISSKGDVYGAGRNDYGQLGDNTTTDSHSFKKMLLPAGVKAKHVTVAGDSTFVLTDDNNIYSTGLCSNGRLGTNYTISGCKNVKKPQRVALPTVNTSNPNTIPTTNIVADGTSVFVRMEGGAVYGWGGNNFGALSKGHYNDSSVPLKIGAYGNSPSHMATQIATDGLSFYVVSNDATNSLKTSGRNDYGQLGRGSKLINSAFDISRHDDSALCVERAGALANYTTLKAASCSKSTALNLKMKDYGQINIEGTNYCFDSTGAPITSGSASKKVKLFTCTTPASSSTDQLYRRDDHGRIVDRHTGKCLYRSATQDYIITTACVSAERGQWRFEGQTTLKPADIPGRVVKVATDQWFTTALTSTGKVYGFGLNESGALGNGKNDVLQMEPLEMTGLPAGVKAVDITSSATDFGAGYSSTFVVGSDGNVYGVGNNSRGQLGIGKNSTREIKLTKMKVVKDVKSVKSGLGTTVILTKSGIVYTVGNNESGQLGDGTTTNRSTPAAHKYTNVLPVTIY